jgi:hypothetical protein
VQAEVGHDDGPVEPAIIEVVAAEGEVVAGAPAEPSDPVRLGLPAGLLNERGPDRGGVLRLGQICPPRFQRGQREVVVSVNEAGQQCPALQIDDLGVRPGVQDRARSPAEMRSPSTSARRPARRVPW